MASKKPQASQNTSGDFAGTFKETLAAAIEQLARAGSVPSGDKPYFFPNGIQSIQITLKAPAEFSLTVSGVPAAGFEAAIAPALASEVEDEDEDEDEEICAAPDDDEPQTRGARGGPAALATAAAPVNTQLAVPATGLYGYTAAAKRFGVAKVIEAVEAIGETWNALHPDAPIGIGNISKNGGGTLPPHASHKNGIDVDMRPMRKDKKQEPIAFTDAQYSKALTQELVNVIRGNDVLDIKMIFFNDPNVTGVQPATGHHNHLHVRFKLS